MATSNFEPGDTLGHWTAIYHRLHRGTMTFLPARGDRPVPNLEHTILHAWTLVTAIVTLVATDSGVSVGVTATATNADGTVAVASGTLTVEASVPPVDDAVSGDIAFG